jgi:hypothetical protein
MSNKANKQKIKEEKKIIREEKLEHEIDLLRFEKYKRMQVTTRNSSVKAGDLWF